MKTGNFLFLVALLLLFSCNYDLKYYNEIVGQWHCVSKDNSSPDEACSGETYQFSDERTFTQTVGGTQVNGAFKIAGNKLHRAISGSPVISVRIKDIQGDTMWWESLDDARAVMVLARK